jgi:anti-anti-sigma factor
MTNAADPELEISIERVSGSAIVCVAGELDLGCVADLKDVLRSLEPPCDRVILDLSRLTFMDSSGMALAASEHRRAVADGFDFVLAGATGAVLRVMRLTGLDVTVPMAPDVASALDDGRPTGPDDRDGAPPVG